MAGQTDTVTKPSRSDEVLDPDHQLQMASQVRAHFESLAPKRPIKPSRSDNSDHNSAHLNSDARVAVPLPEFDKFLSLQSQSQAVIPGANNAVEQDEYVETQYYQQLDSIDKQHHTTGSGFIKVVRDKGQQVYDLRETEGNGRYREAVFKSNPATNDWNPRVEHEQIAYESAKPNRSESG